MSASALLPTKSRGAWLVGWRYIHTNRIASHARNASLGTKTIVDVDDYHRLSRRRRRGLLFFLGLVGMAFSIVDCSGVWGSEFIRYVPPSAKLGLHIVVV